MRYILILAALFIIANVTAQQQDSVLLFNDSVLTVTVQAFNYNNEWKAVPASIAHVSYKQLQMIGTNALLPSMNMVAGVRMEERSPSSYRFSIRGSLLRSPFGVRNIKVYWNNLPLTDGGGNTYLNLIDVTQINTVEIAKGPAASMYGAGTSGVLLLQSENTFSLPSKNQYQLNLNGGSYGLFQENISWKHQSKNFSSTVSQSHQQSDGYRQQSATSKKNITWNSSLKMKHQQLDWIGFYTRLFYETPGGLNLAQLKQDPSLARQPTATLPGAVEQKASIYNNTFFAGLHHTYNINQNFYTSTSLVFNYTKFKNPFITNYEKREEDNIGVNAKIVYQKQIKKVKLQWTTGLEFLGNHSNIEDYGNRKGNIDTVQYKDNIYANQCFAFSQINMWVYKFNLSIGVSANNQLFKYKRTTDLNDDFKTKRTNIELMPRVSLSYPVTSYITLYSLVAKGFSPPSLPEISPSNTTINTALQPEYGWDIETGIKGNFLKNRLLFDMNFYRFRLKDAIVNRTNADGSQYFVNAGNTKQDGFEFWVKYKVIHHPNGFFTNVEIAESYSYQPYKFVDYKQGANDFSGNWLTGVPKNISASTLTIETMKGFFLNASYNHVSSLALSDANDAFANSYHLLQSKIGWIGKINRTTIKLYIGIDNVLNETYSLGNDINALGKRFYNPAPPRNYYMGCNFSW